MVLEVEDTHGSSGSESIVAGTGLVGSKERKGPRCQDLICWHHSSYPRI